MEKSSTITYIENTICDITGIPVKELYTGQGNIPFRRATTRNLCLLFMHDRFSLCYRTISEQVGMTQRSVIRCVRKARILIGIDKEYINYYNQIKSKLGIKDSL